MSKKTTKEKTSKSLEDTKKDDKPKKTSSSKSESNKTEANITPKKKGTAANKSLTKGKDSDTVKSKKSSINDTPVKAETKKKETKIIKVTDNINDNVSDSKIAESKIEKKQAIAKSTDNPSDFDWHNFEEGIEKIDDDKIKEFEKLIEENFVETLTNNVVEGTVVHMTEREAIIDINAKSEGVISLNEFRYNPDLKVGDKVEVLIDIREDVTGQLILSHRKARVIKAWERVNDAYDTGEIVNGFVKCRTKGGMIVDVFGIEAFLPGSQIDVKPIRDYDQFVNKSMEFKVVKINHEFKNVVVSHKALIEADIELQKKEIIKQLEKGQILQGVVKNITSYGVFMDLGGVDGLIHITDLSWSRINHPNEVVELDQEIKVVILDFDEDKSRIQLGLKQLNKHPWEALSDDVKVGDTVKGKVVVIADYGAFVEISEGVEGLI